MLSSPVPGNLGEFQRLFAEFLQLFLILGADVFDLSTNGGLAERLKAHAWKAMTRQTEKNAETLIQENLQAQENLTAFFEPHSTPGKSVV